MCICDSECMQNKYALQFTHALKNMKKKTTWFPGYKFLIGNGPSS